MSRNCAKLIRSCVKKAELKIDIQQDSLSIEAHVRTKMFPPVDKDDHSVMIEAVIEAKSANCDEFLAKAEVQFVFEFDQIPENYQEKAGELCFKQIQDFLFDLLDRLLIAAEYDSLNFKNAKVKAEPD